MINIGRFPPPIGGVSYFLQRLKPYLDDAGINNEMYDISGINSIEKEKKGIICCSTIQCFFRVVFQRKALVVFHSNRLAILIAASILSFKHKIVLFTHGESILKRKDQGFIYQFLLKKIDYFITPTEIIYNNLKKQYPMFENKIFYIPFILFPKHIELLKNKVIKEVRKNSEFLLVGYAYDLKYHKGEDLYGVDMMIKLLYKLRMDGLSVSFILLLPVCTNEEYYNDLLKQINLYKLENYFCILQDSLNEATSLYKMADVYVRPTNTDGDSFSVWESLYVKTPVIASDAAQRPKHCVIFRKRDINDLYQKSKMVLENLEDFKKKLEEDQSIKDNNEDLIKFFLRCISRSI